MNRTWLVIDCDYLCHRARYSSGQLSYEDKPTGVTYGVLREVLSLMDEFSTKYIIFCFDFGFGLRKKAYKPYKANRVDRTKDMTDEELKFEEDFQIQRGKLRISYLHQIGFRNIFFKDGYEGDDIMASVCHTILGKDDRGIMVTSDKDLYQVLSDRITMYDPLKKSMMTKKKFVKEYGVRPDQWSTVKAIAGCSTDNVKGVAGVGEKKAISYLKGELRKGLKTTTKIEAFTETSDLVRNLSLVHLPYAGTGEFRLKKDKLSPQGWQDVITELGFESLRDKFPMPKGLNDG